jgi:hypothetical protein
MSCWIQGGALIAVVTLLAGAGSGCSEKKSEGWYEYSAGVKEWEKTRTEQLRQDGMTQEEAARAVNLEHAIWQTETQRRDKTVQMDPQELQQAAPAR